MGGERLGGEASNTRGEREAENEEMGAWRVEARQGHVVRAQTATRDNENAGERPAPSAQYSVGESACGARLRG